MKRHAAIVVAVLPIILTSFLIFRFKIDVPFADEWEFLQLIEKSRAGDLTFHDFWKQHVTHRMPFPKLVFLLLAEPTNWNITYVLGSSLLLAFCTMMFLIYQIKLSSGAFPSSFMKWLLPITSLLVFSMTQREAWYWGWCLQLFLATTAVVAGIVFLSLPSRRLAPFAVSLVLGVIASFSYAIGLIYWFIGLFVLVLSQKERYRFSKILLWISTGTLVCYSYFSYGYVFDLGLATSQSPLSNIREPVSYLTFVFRGLGSPIVSWDNNLPFGLGIIAFAFTVYSFFRFRKDAPKTFDSLLPFFAFGLYSLGGLLLTGLGRVALVSARTSRYHVFSMLFWVSFFFICFTFIEREEEKMKTQSDNRGRSVHRIALATILLFLISSYARDTYMAVERYRHMLPAQRAVFNIEDLEDTDILKRLYPNAEIVKERIITLQDMKLNVFSESRNTD